MMPLRLAYLAALTALISCSSNSPGDSVKSASAQPNTGPAAAAGSQPAPVALAADMAKPYFQRGAARVAAERFALEDWKAAREGFAAYLNAQRDNLDRATAARLRLFMALSDANMGQWKRAATGFERALEGLPLIADFIHYQAARAHYFAHNSGLAMKHARKVSADSIVGADAELLVGDILRGRKDYLAMAEHYAGYLARRPDGIRLAEARYRLAQAHEQTGKAIPDALDLYRKVRVSAPLSRWSEKAKERIDDQLARADQKTRERYQTMTADELIERGMKYYAAMRNPLSEADFEKALTAPGIDDDSRCVASYYRANSVFKARDRKRAAPLFDQAIAACKKVKNIDLNVKAAYQAGRSYAFIGKKKVALDRYRQAENVSAEHTYVDDARLRQAEEYADMGDDRKVKSTLASIPSKYPDGDMRAEAVWRLGWRAYKDGKYYQAIKWFHKQIEIMPIDNNYWAEGQAQYWMGRTHAKLDRKEQAAAAYREAVLRYPLSYYALLALNRLRQDHPEKFAQLTAEIAAEPKDEAARRPLHFAPRSEYASDGFARALEFIRLGLGKSAEAELRRIGMDFPPGREPVLDPDQAEKIWATAFLYDRAERYSHSHWPTRWHVLDYKRSWPVGTNRERWEIAFPKGFWDLLKEHADSHGFPVELLIAIVREESAFDPLRESYANAIGLTQMIFPTARRFGKGTGIEITRANLRDPEKNVTVGSRFLAFLWDKWQAQAMLVPPSYNAGENAVARWLASRGQQPADEWLENIKTDQARRYSKRVLASYFTYSYLYSATIPEIDFTIPKALLPQKKAKKKAEKKAEKKTKKTK